MRNFLLTIILSISFACLHAQVYDVPDFLKDKLDFYILKGMKEWKIPGLAIGVVKNDKVLIEKGYGIASIQNAEPVDEHTLFMIGSNTKMFTAATLSILSASGQLNLDDKVQQWIPEFRLKDTLFSKETTVTDLLAHRIGIASYQGDFTYWNSRLTRNQIIKKLGEIEPSYGFRNGWGYCNAAYVTAGEIIARATAGSWESALKDHLLTPLNMDRTTLTTNDLVLEDNKAYPHSILQDTLSTIPFMKIDNLGPAGGLSSNVHELNQWMIALLNEGKTGDEQCIRPGILQQLTKPQTIIGIDPRDYQLTHFYLYGLGLFIRDRNGTLVYSHGGAVDGFLSQLMMIPEQKLGIVVLTNTDSNNFFDDLTNEIQDAFLELPFQNHSKRSLTQYQLQNRIQKQRIDSLKKVVSLRNPPGLPLEDYTGRYLNKFYGTIEIKATTKSLILVFSQHPGLTAKMEPLQDHSFLTTYSHPSFGTVETTFDVNTKKVKGFTLHIDDFVEITPYYFEKSCER